VVSVCQRGRESCATAQIFVEQSYDRTNEDPLAYIADQLRSSRHEATGGIGAKGLAQDQKVSPAMLPKYSTRGHQRPRAAINAAVPQPEPCMEKVHKYVVV